MPLPPAPPHLLQLPPAPVLGPAAQALPHDQQLPPLLIINLQLPWYPVGGCSICSGRLLPGATRGCFLGASAGVQPFLLLSKTSLVRRLARPS